MHGKYLQQDPSLRPEIGFIILPLRLTLSYLTNFHVLHIKGIIGIHRRPLFPTISLMHVN